MFRFSALLLFPALLSAGWLEFRHGSFSVLANDNEKQGRAALNYLEQMRHALGTQLGQLDLAPVWPVRIIMQKAGGISPEPRLARDASLCLIHAAPLPEATVKSVIQQILDAYPSALPPALERGLIQLYSTLDVDGTRVTLGRVPAQKDRDWSRAHMLAVHPAYSGKLRVMLSNLSRGIDPDVAYRNAFGKSSEEIEQELNAYLEKGQFETYPVSGKALHMQKDLVGRPAKEETVLLAQADLLLAYNSAGAKAAYEAVKKARPESVEASEGLGILASDATLLAGATSARGLVAAAALQSGIEEKRGLLNKAAAANPNWAQPYLALAAAETETPRQAAALKAAAKAEPRNVQTWMALARVQESLKQFAEANKSWSAAERASDGSNEREEIRQARAATSSKRLDEEAAARDAVKRKAEREMQELRDRAMKDIRAAEDRANSGKETIDPKTLDEYREELPKNVKGKLARVDCLGERARLHVVSGRSTVQLLVPRADDVIVLGSDRATLGCGAQKPARMVSVEYFPRRDAAAQTAGDVRQVEFAP